MKRTILSLAAMTMMWLLASSTAYGSSVFMDDRTMVMDDHLGMVMDDHLGLMMDDHGMTGFDESTLNAPGNIAIEYGADIPQGEMQEIIPNVTIVDERNVALVEVSENDLITATPVMSGDGDGSDLVVAAPVSEFTDPVGIFKEAVRTPTEPSEEKFIIPVEPVYNTAPKLDLVNAVPVDDQAFSPVRFIAGNGVTIETGVPVNGFSSRIELDPILFDKYSGEEAVMPRVRLETSRTITVGESRIKSATGSDISNLIGSETLSSYKRVYVYQISEDGMEILSSAS